MGTLGVPSRFMSVAQSVDFKKRDSNLAIIGPTSCSTSRRSHPFFQPWLVYIL